MPTLQQPHSRTAAHTSLWTRFAAAVCLLLALHLVVLQSWHTHRLPVVTGSVVGHTVAAAPTDAESTEATCPACAALHLAPLAVFASGQIHVAVTGEATPARATSSSQAAFDFSQYSRPPPRS